MALDRKKVYHHTVTNDSQMEPSSINIKIQQTHSVPNLPTLNFISDQDFKPVMILDSPSCSLAGIVLERGLQESVMSLNPDEDLIVVMGEIIGNGLV